MQKHPLTALQLLELAREQLDPPTWYHLAKELNTTPAMVAKWRARNGAYDEDAAWELARITKKKVEEVIAIREHARETNDERRKRWKVRLSRFAAVAFFTTVDCAMFPCHSGEASASSLATNCLPSSQEQTSNERISASGKLRSLVYLSTNYARRVVRALRLACGRFPGGMMPAAS